MAYMIINSGTSSHTPCGKRIPGVEYRASKESAVRRARTWLARLGVSEENIREVQVHKMLVVRGPSPAHKFIVEDDPYVPTTGQAVEG